MNSGHNSSTGACSNSAYQIDQPIHWYLNYEPNEENVQLSST